MDLSTLKMEATRFSETSVLTRPIRLHIPEDGILYCVRCFALLDMACAYPGSILAFLYYVVVYNVSLPIFSSNNLGGNSPPFKILLSLVSRSAADFKWKFTVFLFCFRSYLEGLCTTLYDVLRPFIIHINHLETLAEICSILRLEMLEEHVQNNRKYT
jgi:hypothetical protein